MKARELEGQALDHWVAKALDWWVDPRNDEYYEAIGIDAEMRHLLPVPTIRFAPSTFWSQGGPIIGDHWRAIRVVLERWHGLGWPRSIQMTNSGFLLWAMRAYVASKYGEELNAPI